MRVIAGQLGGRLFAAPHGHRTHPMSDKMRGALFNMLGDITGLTVLDAFAGSGALSFEALSRGASSAVAIDNDRNAVRTMNDNSRELGIAQRLHIISATANAWLGTTNTTFDLVLLDPPYDKLQPELLARLCQRVTADGQVVLSWPGKQPAPAFNGFQEHAEKQYGDGSLHIYRQTE